MSTARVTFTCRPKMQSESHLLPFIRDAPPPSKQSTSFQTPSLRGKLLFFIYTHAFDRLGFWHPGFEVIYSLEEMNQPKPTGCCSVIAKNLPRRGDKNSIYLFWSGTLYSFRRRNEEVIKTLAVVGCRVMSAHFAYQPCQEGRKAMTIV